MYKYLQPSKHKVFTFGHALQDKEVQVSAKSLAEIENHVNTSPYKPKLTSESEDIVTTLTCSEKESLPPLVSDSPVNINNIPEEDTVDCIVEESTSYVVSSSPKVLPLSPEVISDANSTSHSDTAQLTLKLSSPRLRLEKLQLPARSIGILLK